MNKFTITEICKVHQNLKSFFKMEFYAAGRTAEVLRGLFPSTHILQFIAVDLYSEKDTELLNSNSHSFFIKKENGFSATNNDRKLGSFNIFNTLQDCVIYKASSLSDGRKPEFLFRLEKESCVEAKTNIKFLSFEMNFEFWNNNSFFHEETTFIMEAVKDYLSLEIGKVEDIPLIGEMHRYLALEIAKQGSRELDALLERFKEHEHGDLLSQVFFEMLNDQSK